MRFTRVWAMPTSNTFDCPPIGEFVRSYLRHSKTSLDPFARNCRLATHTNDLNPETSAEFHLDAYDFLLMLRDRGVKVDLAIIDPPYSRQQVKEVYNGIGRHYGLEDSQEHSTNWHKERDLIDEILVLQGVVLSFGWNSAGMGLERNYRIEEILLVCHGGAHNDTICVAERKVAHQLKLV